MQWDKVYMGLIIFAGPPFEGFPHHFSYATKNQPVAAVAFTESGGKVMASAQQTQKKSEANMSPVTWQEDDKVVVSNIFIFNPLWGRFPL